LSLLYVSVGLIGVFTRYKKGLPAGYQGFLKILEITKGLEKKK